MIFSTLFFISFSLLVNFSIINSKIFIEEEIVLDTPTGKIYGTLTRPQIGSKFPLALIIAGSGPTDRNGNSLVMQGKNNSLLMLSHKLAQNGIASVRYDKRGIGQSRSAGFAEQDLRFDHYVYDAVFWLRKLKDDKRFKKIGVIGHSEGSLIGMVASTKEKSDFFVSMAGAAFTADEIIRKQLAGQPKEIVDEADRIITQLNEGFTVDSINPMLFSIFRPSVQPYLISWFYYNPSEMIMELECPVLIIQGTSDIQVPEENGRQLAASSPRANFFLIEDMNHVLKITGDDMQKNIDAYTNPELPLADGLGNRIIDFIMKGR